MKAGGRVMTEGLLGTSKWQMRFDTDALQGNGRRPPPQSPISMALGDADPRQTGMAELQLNQVSAYSALCQIRTLAEDKWEALARYSDRLAQHDAAGPRRRAVRRRAPTAPQGLSCDLLSAATDTRAHTPGPALHLYVPTRCC